MKDFPVGPKHKRKAAETKAGKLARAMHQICYDGREGKYVGWSEVKYDGYILPVNVYIPGVAGAIPSVDSTYEHVPVDAILREVRDYLEFESYREVID